MAGTEPGPALPSQGAAADPDNPITASFQERDPRGGRQNSDAEVRANWRSCTQTCYKSRRMSDYLNPYTLPGPPVRRSGHGPRTASRPKKSCDREGRLRIASLAPSPPLLGGVMATASFLSVAASPVISCVVGVRASSFWLSVRRLRSARMHTPIETGSCGWYWH